MTYSNAWDENYPPSSLPANQIHLAIQYWAIAIRQRLNDAFGTTDWATASNPFQPASINFRGATPTIRGGATSLRFRNNADTFDNVTLADIGDLTARRNLISSNNLVSNNDLVFNAANARILPGTTSIRFRNFADNADNLIITDAGLVTFRNTIVVPQIQGISQIIAAPVGFIILESAGINNNFVLDDLGNATVRTSLSVPTLQVSTLANLIGLTTIKKFGPLKIDNGTQTGAVNIAFASGAYQYLIMSGNVVLNLIAPPDNTIVWLRLRQDGVGGRVVTFPANVIPNPVPGSTTANHSQMLCMLYDGLDFLVLGNTDHIR